MRASMGEKLFNTKHVRERLARAAAWRPVSEELATRLEERLGEVKGDYSRVLRVAEEGIDDAFRPAEGPFDVVTANMVLPVVNDVPVFIHRCLEALRPDGLLLMSTLGMESFAEFRAAWAAVGEEGGHVVPLTDVREVGGLLQKFRLALPVVDRDVMTLTFAGFDALYATLRAHGAGNFHTGRRKGLTTPALLKRMEEAYVRLHPRGDGRIPLTLEVIYLHGFRPAEGQPVAAKRGSGRVSLVRILGE